MSRQFVESPICCDTRPCFGAQMTPGGFRRCRVLSSTYKRDGQCPFQKVNEADVPNYKIVKLIAENGITVRKLSMHLKISHTRMYEMMSTELTERSRKKVMRAIMEIVEEKNKCLQPRR